MCEIEINEFGSKQESIVSQILWKTLQGQSQKNALEILNQCKDYVKSHTELYLRQEFFIDSSGICYRKPKDIIPKEQIDLCEKWINEFAEKRKTINGNISSYRLKHIVEEHFGSYISNGAFIQACKNLGYKINDRDGLNALFNIKIMEEKKIK